MRSWNRTVREEIKFLRPGIPHILGTSYTVLGGFSKTMDEKSSDLQWESAILTVYLPVSLRRAQVLVSVAAWPKKETPNQAGTLYIMYAERAHNSHAAP